MLSCRYSILSLDINDLSFFADIGKNEEDQYEIVIGTDQMALLPRSIKQNSLLFQAMERIYCKKERKSVTVARPVHDVIRRFEEHVCVLRWSKQDSSHSEFISKDGTRVFSADEIREHMLKQGFKINDRRMLPAMASASATRAGEYLFLSKDYRDEAVKISTLGMLSYENDLPKFDLAQNHLLYLSKAIAYIGNACSDGVSLDELTQCYKAQGKDPEKDGMTFSLTKKNVIVVDDVNPSDVKNPLCDFRIRGDAKGKVRIEKFPEKGTEMNLSDGFGFISKKLMDKINFLRSVRKPGTKPVSSIIIRLPFVKGMLLAVDMEKYFGAKEPATTIVRDKYNTSHTVQDVDIVLTKSVFKGAAYFEHLPGKSEKEGWEEYMDRLYKSGLSMVIVGTDTPPTELTKTNYQLLSTLNPSKEQLETIAKRESDVRQMLCASLKEEKPDVGPLVKLLRSNYTGEADGEGETEEPVDGEGEKKKPSTMEGKSYSELLADLVEVYPELASCHYLIRSELYDRLVSQALDAAQGRLTVAGDVRILCNDPFLLLEKMESGKANHTKWPINTEGVFYAPGLKAEKVVFERNPHVSPMEDCVLEALKPKSPKFKEYQTYFGDCTGVVFAPGILACAAAGADYDGDRIRLIWEESYIEGVENNIRTFYNWLDTQRIADANGIPEYGSIALEKDNKFEKEKQKAYPAVEISSHGAKAQTLGELGNNSKKLRDNMIKTYLDSIDSRVGLFSNAAVAVAMEIPEANKELNWLTKLAAWCVQVGLDIDSVKLGKRINPFAGMYASRKNEDKSALLSFVSGVKKGRRKGRKREALFSDGMKEGGSREGSALNCLPTQFDLKEIKKPELDKIEKADGTKRNITAEEELMLRFPLTAGCVLTKHLKKKVEQTFAEYESQRTIAQQISAQIENQRKQRLNIYKYLLKQYPVKAARAYYQRILDANIPKASPVLMNDAGFAKHAYCSAEEIRKHFAGKIFGKDGGEECPNGFEYDVTALTLRKHISRLKASEEKLQELRKALEEHRKSDTVSVITGGLKHDIESLAERNNVSMGRIARVALHEGWVDAMYFVILFADALVKEKAEEVKKHADA